MISIYSGCKGTEFIRKNTYDSLYCNFYNILIQDLHGRLCCLARVSSSLRCTRVLVQVSLHLHQAIECSAQHVFAVT